MSSELMEEVERATAERRRAAIAAAPQGFTVRLSGRSGFVYYRETDRVLELYLEISGQPRYDLLVDTSGFDRWIQPAGVPVTPRERAVAENQFREWLKEQTFTTDYQ